MIDSFLSGSDPSSGPDQPPGRQQRRGPRLVLVGQATAAFLAAVLGIALLLDTDDGPRPQLTSYVVERPTRQTTTTTVLDRVPRATDRPPSFVEVSFTRVNPDSATLYLVVDRCVAYQVTVVADDPSVPPLTIESGEHFFSYEQCTAVDFVFVGSPDTSAPLVPDMRYVVTVTIQDPNPDHDTTPVSTTLEITTPPA